MVALQLFENLSWSFVGIDLSRDALEFLLILAQIGSANFKQMLKRCIHHLVKQKFLAVIICADLEVAV